MEETMFAVSDYMAMYQGPHSGDRQLTGRTAQRAMALMSATGRTAGSLEVGSRKHKRLIPTYPKAVLDQAFQEARA